MMPWIRVPLRGLWAAALPIRRLFARKVHANLDRALGPVLQQLVVLRQSMADQAQHMQNIDRRLAATEQKLAAAHACFRDDLSPTLDGVVRDLARLQTQMEILQEAVSNLTIATERPQGAELGNTLARRTSEDAARKAVA